MVLSGWWAGRAGPEGAERSGRIAHGLRHPLLGRRPPAPVEEDVARVSTMETPGRSLVTRRAVIDIVRDTTLNSYGVTGFAASRVERLLGRLGFAQPGIDVRLAGGLSIALDLTVAYGVPIAEVARQVDSAVRYAIRRTLGCEVDGLTIHVDGVAYTPRQSRHRHRLAATRPRSIPDTSPTAGPTSPDGPSRV